MVAELAEIGLRIKGLREACDVSREDMAAELEVPLETYVRWEETGDDVPISAIYHFEDLAWRYTGKIMQPLLVVLDPSDEPAKLVTHTGQEFNLVIEGTVVVTWADKEFELNAGDSIYFNPEHPHGQRCGGDVPAKFVTIIAE